MEAINLFEVLLDAEILGQSIVNKEVTAVINDSRKATNNACFIAIRGEQFDGHNAIEEVVQNGVQIVVVEEVKSEWLKLPISIIKVASTYKAQAILANQFYNQPSEQLKVIAVTGTNGKTTTSTMISELLQTLGRKTGLIGTLHYKVDKKVYPAVNTTPNALHLQSLFSEMVEAGCQDAVIEASSHALYLGRLWYTDIDCAIFTNLTREHLDFHKTMENYAYAKSLVFSQLGQAFKNGKPRLAITNLDDPYGMEMVQVTSADVVTYSLINPNATAFADKIDSQLGTMTFDIHYHGEVYTAKLPMVGDYNVSNYLGAFLCLTNYYQFEPADIIEATKAFKGVEGRTQMINEGQNFEAIVDFAHTADAIERVASSLAKRKQNRLIILLGHSGGNRDSGARPGIGDMAFKYADHIIFTADNPRFESVQKICSELIGQHDEKPYTIIEDRSEAVEFALKMAQENDIVLFAGKGGEPYQVIGDEKVPYYEAELVKRILSEMK